MQQVIDLWPMATDLWTVYHTVSDLYLLYEGPFASIFPNFHIRWKKKLEGRTIYSSLLLFIVRMVAFPKTSSPQIGGNSYACNICFWIINWFIDKLIGWSHIFTPCRSRLVRTNYVQSCIDLTVYHAINNQLISACMQVYIVDVYNIVR